MEKNENTRQAGSERALYEKYASEVYKHCLWRTQNKEAAEDLSQLVFVSVFRYLESFRQESQLKTWIYEITKNACCHYWKRENREKTKIRAFLEAAGPQEVSGGAEEHLLVSKVLDLADPEMLKVLELIHYHGLTQQQVAEIFGVSRVTITKRSERFKGRAVSALGKG